MNRPPINSHVAQLDEKKKLKALFAGYGMMTQVTKDKFDVAVWSRHLSTENTSIKNLRDSTDDDFSPDIIIGSFESDEASRQFWTLEWVQDRLTASMTCVETSTLSPEWVKEWYQNTKKTSATPVECPVTGSKYGALNGTLSAFIYCEKITDTLTKFLKCTTTECYWFNRLTAPSEFKLLYNAWGITILSLLGSFGKEFRTIFAEHSDDRIVAERILRETGWMAPVMASKYDHVFGTLPTSPEFTLKMAIKDMELALPLLTSSKQIVKSTLKKANMAVESCGYGADYSALARQFTESI